MSLSRTLLVLLCAGAALGALSQRHMTPRNRVKKIRNGDPGCTTILMGRQTVNVNVLPPKVITDSVNVVQIPDLGREVTGVKVEVCNQRRDGRPIILPPTAGFSPVQVYSGAEDAWGRAEMVMKITLYIGSYTGQFLPTEENDIFDDDDIYSYLHHHGNVIDV